MPALGPLDPPPGIQSLTGRWTAAERAASTCAWARPTPQRSIAPRARDPTDDADADEAGDDGQLALGLA
jgi:hypothetical protein